MLSYHNDPAVKAKHIALAKHHYEADMLLAGTYAQDEGEAFKACSVGCMAHDIDPTSSNYHAVVSNDAGWPKWLVLLSDSMFEGLPKGEREPFHVHLREAVPVGVDLEPVRHLLAIRRMDRIANIQRENLGKHGATIDAVIQQTLAAIEQIKRCHEAEAGLNACSVDFESAARSAWSAASAAESASESAAWSAASAAWSAAAAAASAAWSAAWSAAAAAASAAESAAWIAERDDLFAILKGITP